MPKRLVLFVEGDGDVEAVPVLIGRILKELNPWSYLFLDRDPFRLGGIHAITGRRASQWVSKLKAAAKRPNLGGVLLLLDGDADHVFVGATSNKEKFCACHVARRLAEEAREAGAGRSFSVACAFALREYESWLLAEVDSLRGQRLPDGRPGLGTDTPPIEQDTDEGPRCAKEWLRRHMQRGYKPTTDQKGLTELVSLDAVRKRASRSFRRLEHAVQELCEAIRSGKHIASPASPDIPPRQG